MNWLPEVCRELHSELVSIYWILIVPLVVILIILELFKTDTNEPNAGKIITRSVVSIILLTSFKETINFIAEIADGISEKIDSLANINEIMSLLSKGLKRDAPALYKLREAFIFLLNFISYFLAYFGIFIANALIHFTWSVLFVCSPLMILCYIPQGCANIAKNLYKGLLTVVSWKILWSVLSVFLLKLITEQTHTSSDNTITTAIVNLSVALSILFIPIFSRSLIGDGLSTMASGIAGVAGAAVTRTGKQFIKRGGKKAIDKGRGVIGARFQRFQKRDFKPKNFQQKERKDSIRNFKQRKLLTGKENNANSKRVDLRQKH